MKIYVAHSREFDYESELYKPLRNNEYFNDVELILPHEEEHSNTTRDFYQDIDIMIAEVSFPSIGLGIELGYAYDDNKKIYCLYKKGNKISGSLRYITDNIYEYSNVSEMLEIIKRIIMENKKVIKKHII